LGIDLIYALARELMQKDSHNKFKNRIEAGVLLANQLSSYSGLPDLLVLGLPRGGVPVAYEVAKKLKAPLDVALVRKLGVPGHKELAMGAIASGGVKILNYDVISSLKISQKTIDEVTSRELQELARREKLFRGNRLGGGTIIKDHTVILIDDGIATGSTMRAAITILKAQRPAKLILAVPVGPTSIWREFGSTVDEIVCLKNPEDLYAIGLWYEDFSQTSEEEVCAILEQANATSLGKTIDKPEG
jgi:orotate phosphoribosyltransferase